MDALGNVLVTGYSQDASYDYLTIKYHANGIPLWTNRFDGPEMTMTNPPVWSSLPAAMYASPAVRPTAWVLKLRRSNIPAREHQSGPIVTMAARITKFPPESQSTRTETST
jgi:hypothetical protein